MSLKNEVNSAIATHSIWKSRLERAIDAGVFDSPVETIARDDECNFGKWLLYGQSITQAIRDTEEYKRVADTHAKFHHAAAKVVELAISDDKIGAAKLMASTGEYTLITTKLVRELEAWADKLA